MVEPIINIAALEPLFAPHEEPNQHRARAQGNQPAQTKKGRRPSKIAIAQSLRSHVKQWRETDYPGASDTTRELLHHWFERDHLIETSGGLRVPFRYYFCQREAIETFIYLYEVRRHALNDFRKSSRSSPGANAEIGGAGHHRGRRSAGQVRVQDGDGRRAKPK